jgi:predicted RNase H-like nuclease (RuvC/YqgF family)
MFSKAGKSLNVLEGIKSGSISDFYLTKNIGSEQKTNEEGARPEVKKELERFSHSSLKEKIEYFQNENDALRKLLEEIASKNLELKRKLGFVELDDSEEMKS